MTAPPGERLDLRCPECGFLMRLRRANVAWKKNNPFFYGCTNYPDCRATHGAHPDGSPLGVPADRATKDARIRAHAAFDPLWHVEGQSPKRRRERRQRAYRWLSRQMGVREIHIAELSLEECERVVAICRGVSREQVQNPAPPAT